MARMRQETIADPNKGYDPDLDLAVAAYHEKKLAHKTLAEELKAEKENLLNLLKEKKVKHYITADDLEVKRTSESVDKVTVKAHHSPEDDGDEEDEERE